jgi:hypothetical protein
MKVVHFTYVTCDYIDVNTFQGQTKSRPLRRLGAFFEDRIPDCGPELIIYLLCRDIRYRVITGGARSTAMDFFPFLDNLASTMIPGSVCEDKKCQDQCSETATVKACAPQESPMNTLRVQRPCYAALVNISLARKVTHLLYLQ